MTDKDRLINEVHIKLSKALKSIGIVEVNYYEDNAIGFALRGYNIKISVDAKIQPVKK